MPPPSISVLFFFNDTATTEIYTLSLHDALPICRSGFPAAGRRDGSAAWAARPRRQCCGCHRARSEEHTSELQSHLNLVCRLLLEKKKNTTTLSTLLVTKPKHPRFNL